MKKKQIFLVSICLLLCCVFPPINASPEDDEEHMNITGTNLPPLKLVNSFCAFKEDGGPCRAYIPMYFFNIFTQECEEFIYGGCLGNKNRFGTLEECKENCVREKPDFCFLEEDPGICRGYITRYFYNNQSKQCESFKYGGCLGNLNNFESLEECKNTCENPLTVTRDDAVINNVLTSKAPKVTKMFRPTKAPKVLEYLGPSFCKAPAEKGLCQANETRFYYNFSKRKCLSFSYSGCGGNDNNFVSKIDCLKACRKGFIEKIKQGGLIKTRRKYMKKPVRVVYEETAV